MGDLKSIMLTFGSPSIVYNYIYFSCQPDKARKNCINTQRFLTFAIKLRIVE